ncbi:hypothetical protein LYNGBM3L_14340 [Moorena producens 3L]|uniref:Uncharacterized protein n=1 Tax=Moorena producens 3L TaxID=489825 RepID=F4XLA9_9CYAN|nr:hypothetical protein LYNGBM3L_14340 [Moorena producens 3L]
MKSIKTKNYGDETLNSGALLQKI